MDVLYVPFTNNQMEDARICCRARCYLSICRKNSIEAVQPLTILFNGKLPDFLQEKVARLPAKKP